ncbi:hypothetical protein Trydic_g8675 [Trypoxylus dichotomus]
MLLEPPTYVSRQQHPTSSVVRETNGLVKVSSLPDDVKKHVAAHRHTCKQNIYIGENPIYTCDSVHFVEKLRKIQFNPRDILVNFHVVSVFTKVPLIDTLRYIADLFPPDITQVFKDCLKTSYFTWDGSFYEQMGGVAMGSLLSAVIANVFMERFKTI